MKVVSLITSPCEQSAFGLTGLSRPEIGTAAAVTASVSGSRISTDQVSSAEETCSTCAFASGSVPALLADGELDDQVRHLVGRDIGGAQAARPHGLREDDGAKQAEDA